MDPNRREKIVYLSNLFPLYMNVISIIIKDNMALYNLS